MTAETITRPDTHEMVVVHRVFRREFRLAGQMVRNVAGQDVQRAAVVAAHLAEMSEMLHHHHTAEDELLWPRLHQRVAVEQDLLTRMEQQHEQLAALLRQVEELLPQWRVQASESVRDQLAGVLDQVHAGLEQHLDEEEKRVLPLAAEHLTVQEWEQIGERARTAIPKSRMLVVLASILEDASPVERAAMLAHLPLPARLAYRFVGQRKYAQQSALLRRGIVPQQRLG